MMKRVLTIAAFGAALFVWPSCGGGNEDDAEKAQVFQYIRSELNGTWKGTTQSQEVVTVTFALADDTTKILLHKCASRGLVQAAFACLNTYDLPVVATIDSTNGTYQGQLEGSAKAYAVTGGVDLALTGATTLYGHAVGPDLNASVGTSNAVTIDFVRK
ncbi:MAG TPA: hypothetical protein VGK67_00945 [Myxococcales bacterium]|jgi:hypothetical protein